MEPDRPTAQTSPTFGFASATTVSGMGGADAPRSLCFSYVERNPIVIAADDSHIFGVDIWITRARQIIKSLLAKCVACQKVLGPNADRLQAPFPADRTVFTIPFAVTGINSRGPSDIRTAEGSEKTCIALFTCAESRTVYLEFVSLMYALTLFSLSSPIFAGFSLITIGRCAATGRRRPFCNFNASDCRALLDKYRILWEFTCVRALLRGTAASMNA